MELIYFGTVTAKKNNKRIITNRRTGKPMIVSNQRAKAQENEMAWCFIQQMHEKGIESLYNGSLDEFSITISIMEQNHVRRDLDNQATAVLDALVMAGAIPDDSNKYVKELHIICLGYDNKKPYVRIIIDKVSR